MRKLVAALALASATIRVNEAAEVSLESMMAAKMHSEAEIMANMTIDRALEMVLGMGGTQQAPEVAALIRDRLSHIASGRVLRGRARARHLSAASKVRADAFPVQKRSSYPALDSATNALNKMLEEAKMKIDLSQIQCRRFERNQIILMQETVADVSSFNSQAAESRGGVLEAQAQIGLLNTKIPQVQGELSKHRANCRNELATLQKELTTINGDLKVVKTILGMTKCNAGATSGVVPSLLQEDEELELGDEDAGLVECEQCAGGQGLIMLQNAKLQPLLNSLRSEAVQGFVQQHLRATVHGGSGEDDSGDPDTGEEGGQSQDEVDSGAVALTQAQVRHMTTIMQRVARIADMDMDMADPDPTDAPVDARIQPEPQPPSPVDCVPTTQCKLTKGSCNRLQDKFLLVQGEVEDKRDETTTALRKLEYFCKATDASLVGQLVSMGDKLRDVQAALALHTKSQIDAETSARQKGSQHADLKKEYTSTLTKCCEEQNTQRAEVCALIKIRGELFAIEGATVVIQDCVVSGWTAGQCSATCGGGFRTMTREITVKADGGAACPPLTEKEECNAQPCPTDCVLSHWSGWSSCTARCGGGVRERARHIRVPMKNGGSPCEDTEESESCNVQSCNRNCVLNSWSDWGACNKACNTGRATRLRSIKKPAMGTGRCWRPDSGNRRQWRWCNRRPCHYIVPMGRTYLQCSSKTDIILLVDSSGSLGSYGWAKSKQLAEVLVESFTADQNAGNKVALLEFSAWGRTRWVKHLSEGASKRDVTDMPWLRSGTWTHEALGMAEAELIYVREEATPVVIVITDGKPFSWHKTWVASKRLSKKVKTLWLPVGRNAPIKLVQQVASWPWYDYTVRFPNFAYLTNKYLINDVVGKACTSVK